ncbi:histidine phosphatase family protein, partial [Pseudomonas sp. KHB2.9]
MSLGPGLSALIRCTEDSSPMTIKPLCLAQRLKRYSYIILPLLLVGGALDL